MTYCVFVCFLTVVFWLQQTQQILIWYQASLSHTFVAANCFFRKENVKCKDLKLFASILRSLSTHLNSILDNNLFAGTTVYIFIADLLMITFIVHPTCRKTESCSWEGHSLVCYYLPYISAALLTLSLAH